MFREEICRFVFKRQGKTKYCVIDNGYKTWIIPYNKMKNAVEMFSEYSFNGRAMKHIFTYTKWSRLIRKKAGCKIEELTISDELKSIIEKYVEEKYECAIYFGNLDTVQNYKAVVQVFNECRTLLYIKLSMEDIVKESFRREKNALELLNKEGVRLIPCIEGIEQVGKWKAMVQKPQNVQCTKTKGFNGKHWNFLENMCKKNMVKCQYKNTDLYPYLNSLHNYIEERNTSWKDIIVKALERAEGYLNSIEEFSFGHGDFSPWNIKETVDEIYVYDFEYCLKTTVPYMDYFHFLCQHEIIKKNPKPSRVIKILKRDRQELEKHIKNIDDTFIVYLLFIISFYIRRNNGKINEKNSNFLFRIALLEEML